MMRPLGTTFVKIFIGVLIAIGIIGYSLYQARNIILGPQISITSPINGETVNDPYINISGTTKNITYISLNNRQIFVDNKGVFNEDLLLLPGYNVWEAQAKDKFGRIITKKIEVVFVKNS